MNIVKKILLTGGLLVISYWLLVSTFFFTPAYAQVSMDSVNQKVCDRFEEDLARMSAIMDELRSRKGITETRVAFGGYDTPIKQADYWINFAAEAIAYQRAQKLSSPAGLRSHLEVLKGKVLRAKDEVGKTLDEE